MIANGITASDESLVNCDKAEKVSDKIQQFLNDLDFKAAKVKSSEKVKTLSTLQSAVKIADEEVSIDLKTLFARLVALVMRENDSATYLSYELSPYPASF